MSGSSVARRDAEQSNEGRPVVIVGYDGSDPSRAALRVACEFAPPGAAINVVHCYHAVYPLQAIEPFEDIAAMVHDIAADVLDTARDIDPGRGDITVEYELQVGRPATCLVDLAKARRAATLVVGARGTDGARIGLGGVAHRLVHDAPCPLLVVPS